MNTTAQRIPHLRHPKMDLLMPVKLVFEQGREPKPKRIDGRLVYALPGGFEYVV